MKRSMMLVALTSAVLVACSAAQAVVTISWANVGDANNTANDVGLGSVAYRYAIAKFEVTNAQYVDFLNAVATTSDPRGLYNTNMAGTINAANPFGIGGITRSTVAGKYTYTLRSGWGDKPVNFVSYYDSLRFINWLENGQPGAPEGNGTTETGAYNLAGGSTLRGATAHYWLPSENEWVKAAYYKGGSTNAGYWDYPTQSNTAPGNPAPVGGANSANYFVDDYAVGGPAYVNNAGAYTNAKSAYGAQDMAGNVWELVDAAYQGLATMKVARGGAFNSLGSYLAMMSSDGRSLTDERYDTGFRIAGQAVDEPPPVVIVTGALNILKFNDHNHNGIQDGGDEPLAGWSYHIVGSGYDQTKVTDANGKISLTLDQGQYTITESGQANWVRTTPYDNPFLLTLGDSASATFGGYLAPEPATLAAMALGGLLVARSRRRRGGQ